MKETVVDALGLGEKLRQACTVGNPGVDPDKFGDAVDLAMAVRTSADPDLHLLSRFKSALSAHLSPGQATRFLSLACGKRFSIPRSLPMVQARAHLLAHGTGFHELVAARTGVVVRDPVVFGAMHRRETVVSTRSVFLAAAPDAIVRHRSSLVESGGALLLDAQGDETSTIDVQFNYDPAILDGDDTRGIVVWPEHGANLSVDEAIHLGGASSYAFGHWMLDYLPKLMGLLRAARLPIVPILIDGGMPRQHRHAIELLCGEFPIVEIPPGGQARVGKLWICSSWAFAPIFPRPGQELGPQRLSPPTREFADLVRWTGSRLPSRPARGEKYYFARKLGRHRKMANAGQIVRLAQRLGYRVVYPEEHGLGQQLAMVRSASAIAGPEGSSMLLAMHAHPGTKITIANHPFLENIPGIAAVYEELGLDLCYVHGRCTRRDAAYPRFSDYEIDEADFSQALGR